MTVYIWIVVQQMYVSLTYPFNIVQHTLSHIVEHRKLDGLATPDNIVWLTVTSCWTNNVHQFDPNLSLFNFCFTVMGFFEPSAVGGGHDAPHHKFVVIALMIMKFGRVINLDVLYTVG